MIFTLLDPGQTHPQKGNLDVYLVGDNWDDWFRFRTRFTLFVFDQGGVRRRVGSVKIGEAGLQGGGTATTGFRAPQLPRTFPGLDPSRHFSLGQDEDFYSTLHTLPADLCRAILTGLCDCSFDLAIFDLHLKEPAMQESLLRSVREENVRNRLHRLAHGNEALTRFQFQYTLPAPPVDEGQLVPPSSPTLAFYVEPHSYPPTNVHVLIGRNGAGKTRCIQTLINAVLGRQSDSSPPGILQRLGDNQDEWAFAGLVSVSFSAFDEFEAPPQEAEMKLRAGFVGLRATELVDGQARGALKTKDDLGRDFVESFAICREEPRRSRWVKAVQTLATDPLFAEVDIERFLLVKGDDWKSNVAHAFKKLSSGHSIVLLTTTRLVELVDESTLVVLDEPEGHLHPPLLAAFVRAVSDLLVSRNGVALISTHSPVVLQEVPMSCVWMLTRSRTVAKVERPPTETFGESAGVLTRAVFGLEVEKSGFHQMVVSVANESGYTFEEVTEKFGGALGSEARVLARTIIAQRPN
jgi:hypothetical protein